MSQLDKVACYADHVLFMLEESTPTPNPEHGYIVGKPVYDTICHMLADIRNIASDELKAIIGETPP